MRTKSIAREHSSEEMGPDGRISITGVVICMPMEIIPSPSFDSAKMGPPIMPEGFVIDSGFLLTSSRVINFAMGRLVTPLW